MIAYERLCEALDRHNRQLRGEVVAAPPEVRSARPIIDAGSTGAGSDISEVDSAEIAAVEFEDDAAEVDRAERPAYAAQDAWADQRYAAGGLAMHPTAADLSLPTTPLAGESTLVTTVPEKPES